MQLLSFLRARHPLAPERVLQSALKARDVKLNGIRVSGSTGIRAGDLVVWFTTWKEPDLEIIYEDDNLMIVNKPSGISSDRQEDGAMSVEEWGERRGASIVHRLDQQTSGLIILSKNDAAKAALEEALRMRQIEKRYQCLVAGVPEEPHGVLRAYLYKDSELGRVSVSEKPGRFAKEIVTEYDVMEAKGDYARLLITLHTGRTHQIRVHMAYAGHGLIGDQTYGGKRRLADKLLGAAAALGNEFPRQALHAASLGFDHPVTGERLEFQAPLPADMAALVAALRAV